jgi:hypothetical protein
MGDMIKAGGFVISDICRETHGDDGAIKKGLDILENEIKKCIKIRGDQKGLKYHVIFYVESLKNNGNRSTNTQ